MKITMVSYFMATPASEIIPKAIPTPIGMIKAKYQRGLSIFHLPLANDEFPDLFQKQGTQINTGIRSYFHHAVRHRNIISFALI
jgi:hypothetical protein